MAEDSLEDRLEASPSNGSSIDTKFLEEKAKTRKPRGLFGTIMDYTIAASAAAASYAAVGPMALWANAIGFVGNRIVNFRRKRDTPSRQTRNTAIMSSIMAVPGKLAFDAMNYLIDVTTMSGWLLRGAVQQFGYFPAMTVLGTSIGHPLVHGTTTGLYDYGLRDLGVRNYKTGLKWFAIPNMLVARYLPDYTHFPISLANNLVFRTTVGSRFLYEVDPYKYEHKILDGKPANGYAKNNSQNETKNNYGPQLPQSAGSPA